MVKPFKVRWATSGKVEKTERRVQRAEQAMVKEVLWKNSYPLNVFFSLHPFIFEPKLHTSSQAVVNESSLKILYLFIFSSD